MTNAPVTVEVKLPDLTKRLLNAVQAVMALPPEWKSGATFTLSVDDLSDTIANALLPDKEHNEDICSTGLVVCPECCACGDAEAAE